MRRVSHPAGIVPGTTAFIAPLLTIQPALLAQEPYFSFGIAPYKGNDDGLLFTALETVHAPQLDARELFFQGCEHSELLVHPMSASHAAAHDRQAKAVQELAKLTWAL